MDLVLALETYVRKYVSQKKANLIAAKHTHEAGWTIKQKLEKIQWLSLTNAWKMLPAATTAVAAIIDQEDKIKAEKCIEAVIRDLSLMTSELATGMT